MGKREARVARKHEKFLRQQEKNVRLIKTVSESHTPSINQDPKSIMQMYMEYEILKHADREGTWSWGQNRNWCNPEYGESKSCDIRSTMIAMSALRWHEILAETTGGKDRRKKHHPQSFDSICSEAQNRWIEIERSEEELFRFRTGGKERIWGFRAGHTFYVVWWDAMHKIYPVD